MYNLFYIHTLILTLVMSNAFNVRFWGTAQQRQQCTFKIKQSWNFASSYRHTNRNANTLPICYQRSLISALPPLFEDHSPNGAPFATEHIVPVHCFSLQNGLRSRASKDLHNIFACPVAFHYLRKKKIFGVAPTKCPFETSATRSAILVGDGFRGTIARAVLYMCRYYNCNAKDIVENGEATLWQWHASEPAAFTEQLHNYLVARVQNRSNWLISNQTKPVNMLNEFIAPQGNLKL